MLRKIAYFFSILSLVLLSSPALAAKPDGAGPADVPEQDGTYDVPGHPELKVKVFVHREPAKPSRPGGGGSSLVCSLPDPDSSSVIPGAGWHLADGNTIYRLNVGSAPSSVASVFSSVAQTAFNTWSSAVSGQVTFSQGADTSVGRATFDGQNIVTFGRTSGSALAVTYTWYNSSTHVAVETDTVFNLKFAWNWSDFSSGCAWSGVYDVQNILTHELGHWMGLNDTYTVAFSNNTMYGYGSTMEIKKDTLTAGDIAGVQALY